MSRFYLKELHINEIAGIYKPFSITNIQPGLNIVLGPNGSGKTTLCRAITSLLWGDSKQRSESLRAVWASADDEPPLEAARNTGVTIWSSDGKQQAVPKPASYLADCFVIKMEDLLPAGRERAELSREIEREIAGGFDLAALAANPAFKPYNGRLATLKSCVESTQELATETRRLKAEEAGLADLQRLQRAERDLLNSRNLVEAAAERLARIQELQDLDLALVQLPPEMGSVAPGDASLVHGIESALQQAWAEERALRDEVDLLDARIGASPVRGLASDTIVHRLDTLVHDLRSIEREVAEAGADCASASERLHSLLNQQAGNPAIPRDNRLLDRAAVNAAEELITESLAHNAQLQGITHAVNQIRKQIEPEQDQPLDAAIQLLTEWILAGETDAKQDSFVFVMLFVLAIVASLGEFAVTRSWIALIVLGIGVVGVTLQLAWSKRNPPQNSRPDIQKRFAETGIKPPEWTVPAVRSRLEAFFTQWAGRELSRSLLRSCDMLENQIETIKTAIAGLDERRSHYSANYCIDLDRLNMSAALLLRAAAEQSQAMQLMTDAQARASHLSAEQDRLLNVIRNEIAFCMPDVPVADCAEAESVVQQIRSQCEELSSNVAKRSATAQQLDQVRSEIGRREEERATFLAARHAATLDELKAKEARMEEYQRLRSDALSAERSVQIIDKRLAGRLDLLDATHQQLETLLQRIEQGSKREEEFLQQINLILAKVDGAKHNREVSDASARLNDAVSSASDLCRDALVAEAGKLLVQQLAAAAGRQSPTTLRRASELFSLFTRNAYRVEPVRDGTGGSVRILAVEQDSGRRVELAHLSGGTRVQLLMAVRIAFAESAPSFVNPPIFIDEALANSDPERFEAAAVCLRELAAAGRQIFFLTSDPEDIQRLERTANGESVHLINMAQVRSIKGIEVTSSLQITPLSAVPLPGDMSSIEYASAIGVPLFSAADSINALHIWYLLADNLPLLHTLLTAGINTVGRCGDLSEIEQRRIGISEADAEPLTRRIALAHRFMSGWTIGRGKPVTRAILEEVGVPPTFIDRAWESAKEAGCLTQPTLKAIKSLPRFRNETAASVEDRMLELGLIDDPDAVPLDKQQLMEYVMDRPGAASVVEAEAIVGLLLQTLNSGTDVLPRH